MKYNFWCITLSIFITACSTVPKTVSTSKRNTKSRVQIDNQIRDREFAKAKSSLEAPEVIQVRELIRKRKYGASLKAIDAEFAKQPNRTTQAKLLFLRSQAFRQLGLKESAYEIMKTLSARYSDVDWNVR